MRILNEQMNTVQALKPNHDTYTGGFTIQLKEYFSICPNDIQVSDIILKHQIISYLFLDFLLIKLHFQLI